MQTTHWLLATLFGAALSAGSAQAFAPPPPAPSSGPIAGLVNTGDGVSGGQQDFNYSFEVVQGSAPAGNGFGFVPSGSDYPAGIWLASDASSQWLTPTASGWQSYDPTAAGEYRWTLQFDLRGFDAASATLSGRFMADNQAEVRLNQGAVLASSNSFATWTAFGAGSGFDAGLNSLEFIVTNAAQNGGNPTGLRVEFLASHVSAVPEPDAWALLAIGLLAVGVVVNRRQRRG